MARKNKSEEEPEDYNERNEGNDDTFGLPEIEYEPLNRDSAAEEKKEAGPASEPAQEEAQPAYSYSEPEPETNANTMDRDDVPHNEYNETYYEEEEGSQWPKVLGIVVLLLLVGAAVWYFGWKRPADERAAEAARIEEVRQDSIRQAEANIANEQRRLAAEREAARADSLARVEATPAVGTVETLNERTGRYYVVVASAIDGDLVMDYARKLSAKGISTKIIPPYGTVKFHRLTVAEGDSFAAAAQRAAELKGEYSEDLWVIRY